jgi:hypothetical protein
MGDCETCAWWGGKISGRTYTPGPCYRYPPQVIVRDRYGDKQNARPIMAAHDWCGEYTAKATRP